GDPGVGTLDAAPAQLRGNCHLGPQGAELAVIGKQHKFLQIQPQPFAASRTPLGLDSPAVQFRQSHEGDHQGTPGEVGFVDGVDGMALENERDDVGIDDDTSHAAGSTLLVWPRHSWSAARNSSIDSSSAQKSPCRTDRSVIGPLPCWAISSSTL